MHTNRYIKSYSIKDIASNIIRFHTSYSISSSSILCNFSHLRSTWEGSGAMFFCQVFYLLWFFYLFFLKSPIGFFRKSLRTFWKNHMNFLKKPYEFLHKNLIDFLIVMVFLQIFSLLWFFTHLIRVKKP